MTGTENITVSQWANVDELLTWFLIYGYNINWLIARSYPARPGVADGCVICRAHARARAY